MTAPEPESTDEETGPPTNPTLQHGACEDAQPERATGFLECADGLLCSRYWAMAERGAASTAFEPSNSLHVEPSGSAE